MAEANFRVLLGCCEPSVTTVIRLLLAESRPVTARGHFDELVRDASAGEFDLVIVYGNCMTPPLVCDGGPLENTVAAIKASKAARSITVVALTSTPEWRGALLGAGAESCVTTPFKLAEFRQAVEGCLQNG